MSFSIRAIIRGLVAPDHILSCNRALWANGLKELKKRGSGRRESGAFLLGFRAGDYRCIRRFVYYDDLDPHSLDSGIVVFDGAGYGPLWALCRDTGMTVVGDVHTHPGVPRQSGADRVNPMVATSGHIALIVPNFAETVVGPAHLGVYEYKGSHQWIDHSGPTATRFFYLGIWG